MEHLIHSRHKRLLSALLLGAATLYGLTTSALVNAEDVQQPIYPDPATSANSCMADAYFNTGGSGMKGTLGESLNCTANDVEITEVTPLAIILPDDTESDILTCTLGQTFKLKADVRVRANAAERWDTTFYVPRKEGVNPDTIYQDGEACSILLPVPIGTEGYDPLFLKAQNLDGDVCGDIKKSELTADEYTLEGAVFEIICEDGDEEDPDNPPDGKADFNYCAAWDNIERNNCSDSLPHPGQVPNNKSKCKCDNFPIDVTPEPEVPQVIKSVTPSSSNEPEGTFRYTLKITKGEGADVTITSIYDVYRSSTDNSIYKEFNLNAGADDQGILNLLDLSPDHLNTCKGAVPTTLTDASPTLSCSFSIQISDEDLPDDPDPTTENAAEQPQEKYDNFIRFSATDSLGRGIIVGDDTCDPIIDPASNVGNCSNIKTVSMINVDPEVEITKTPVSGPGLRNVGGVWYIDDEGFITYEVTVTNKSLVDAAWIIQLTDDNGTEDPLDDIDLLSDESGSPACKTATNSSLSKTDGTFTCRYTVDVTVNEGNTYTNEAKVIVNDNEARAASDTDTASITRAEPMISLLKDVAVWVDSTTPLPALGDPAFAQEAEVDEPGGRVVYQFTITNANSVTKEDIYVTSLIDDVLFGSSRATSGPQRTDECDFTTPVVVEYGTPYQCTLVADVTGNGSDDSNTVYDDTFLLNTAQVTAKRNPGDDTEAPTYSNQDTAQVNFINLVPSIESKFGFHANVFVKVTNKSTFEAVTVHNMFVRGVAIPDGNDDVTVEVPDPNGQPGDTLVLFKMFDDSQTVADQLLTQAFGENIDPIYPYCQTGVPIAALQTYRCFIRVQIFDAFGVLKAFDADENDNGGITVQVIDDDNTISEGKVNVKVEALNVDQ